MNLKMFFTAKDNIIPLSYRMMISSIIKKNLEKSDKEYMQRLYYYKDRKNLIIKPFCCSLFLYDYKIDDNEIHIKNEFFISISSPDKMFIHKMIQGMNKNYVYKKYKLHLVNYKVSDDIKHFKSSKIKCSTLSPLYVTNKEHKPISVNSEHFEKELNYICNISLQIYRGQGLKKPLKFIPLNMKKIVSKEIISSFSKKDFYYIEAYKGTFILKGDPEDLYLLLQLGIGFRRSEGFGAIKLKYLY